ncbi:MAG: hypothetical protein LKE28_08385 [Sphaerochaeta sp.]|nr:hypothetical protein [Sphaerochaeta sp.]
MYGSTDSTVGGDEAPPSGRLTVTTREEGSFWNRSYCFSGTFRLTTSWVRSAMTASGVPWAAVLPLADGAVRIVPPDLARTVA